MWRRRDRQRDVGRHAPALLSSYPLQNHEEWFGHWDLAGVGDRDAYRNIGLGNVAAQRDDLFLVVVRIDVKRAGFVEIFEVLQNDLSAPKACPIAFRRRRGLSHKKRVGR